MNNPQLQQFAGQMGIAGKSMPMRLLSRSRPDGILARIMIITLILVLISYLIFGLVQAFTDDQYKLLRGKLIMLGSLMLVSILLGLIATPIITTIRKDLDIFID